MAKKRVFILGAGFSKQAGLPLANDLMPLLVKQAKLKDDVIFNAWLTDFETRLKNAEGMKDADGLNFEQCFDFAMFDIELWRMLHQREVVSESYGSTASRRAKERRAWLGYLEKAIPTVFWKRQKEGRLGKIGEFTEHLTEDDTVVTFNYDTLVEQALTQQRTAWSHGLEDKTDGSVTVLKMHGSVDWFVFKRDVPPTGPEKFVKLFSKIDLNAPVKSAGAGDESPEEDLGLLGDGSQPEREPEYDWELWRAKDQEVCDALHDKHRNGFWKNFGIAGLGRYKPLHRLIGSGETWYNAFKALKETEEVYAVGFSMSQYDTMTRFHFASVMGERETPVSKAMVIDPRAFSLADAYRSVFGDRLTLMARKAECVDWQKLLSEEQGRTE